MHSRTGPTEALTGGQAEARFFPDIQPQFKATFRGGDRTTRLT